MKQKRERSKGVLTPLIFVALAIAVTLCGIGIGTASAATTVEISPSAKTVNNSDMFTLYINVTPDEPIRGVQCDLSFNQSLVTVNSVTEGNLLSQDGADTMFGVIEINNTIGSVDDVYCIIISGSPVSSPGTFAIINLTADAANTGTTDILLSDVKVRNATNAVIPTSTVNGSITVGVPPVNLPPNVSVIYPNGGEVLTGTVTANATASDSDGTVTNVEFLYSADAGSTWTSLGSDTTEPYEYEWDTTAVANGANYLIKAIATDDDGATAEDTSDGTFTIENIPTTTVVTITPSPKNVGNSDTFTLNITVNPIEPIRGVQCDLSFNQSLVTVNSVTEGNLLSQDGADTMFGVIEINNTIGSVDDVYCIIISGSPVSSPGTFAIINLTADAANTGTTDILLSDVKVRNATNAVIPTSTVNGSVIVGVAAEHDVYVDTGYTGTYGTGIRIDNATTEEIPLTQNLTIGDTYFIKYKIVNKGTAGPEDVNITVKVSNATGWTTELANYQKTINVYSLGNDTWDTTGLTAGVYTITVNASIADDANPADNKRTREVVLETAAPGEPDLNVEVITPKCGEIFANETNNITATIKNNGTADAGAFNVSFIIGEVSKEVRISGLAAGASEEVTVTDTTERNAGESVTITVIADCDGEVTESDDTNNVMSKTFTVYNNGYKNKSFMGMDSLELFEHEEEMYGGVVYNVSGTKYYGFAPTNTSTRIHHIEIPAGMTVKKARLYVYWYDYWSNPSPGCMANLSVNFNGTTFTTPDAAYTDQKGFGKYNTPKGTYAYDVTPLVTRSGDYTVIVENIDPNNKTTLLGEMLFVVYEDPTETTNKIQLWILEGNDLLMAADDTHGSYNYGVSPEEATATVTFPGTIDVANVSSATLISVVAQGNEPGANMLFNGEVVKSDAWDSPTEVYPNSKINVESVDVTANLNASGNNMGFQDTGTSGMQASNAILVVTRGLPKTGNMDGIGTVDFADAMYLARYVIFGADDYPLHADGNVDSINEIDFADAIYLARYVIFGEDDYPLYP